jgi:hypothetical protein
MTKLHKDPNKQEPHITPRVATTNKPNVDIRRRCLISWNPEPLQRTTVSLVDDTPYRPLLVETSTAGRSAL